MMMQALTEDERKAVVSAVRGSIDLYGGYVKLRPESPVMARKQGQKRRALGLLTTALAKLRTQREAR
jgi:hypothetical protein